MYCPACSNEGLRNSPDSARVVDFACDSCGAEYQLKSTKGRFGAKVPDAAYEPMMRRISANNSPHFAFLRYSTDTWRVQDLLLVPGHFITASTIERRRPLSSSARRSGWVGCNIVLRSVPPDGQVLPVSRGTLVAPARVRAAWARLRWMEDEDADTRSWTADVLRCVRTIGRARFSLADVYRFEGELSLLHPRNRNVRPKIRQQLQVLRDQGVLDFAGRGRYQLPPHDSAIRRPYAPSPSSFSRSCSR